MPDPHPLSNPHLQAQPQPQSSSPVDQKPVGVPRIVAAILLFALGFIATAVLIHTAIPDPLHLHADVRSEKLLLLDQQQGSVFSAAFGSSHVHNGFDPRAFDQAAAHSPIQTRSLNLAVIGGSQAEQRVMALEFLHHLKPPAQPEACLVLLELNAGANFQNSHLIHPRAINVYDWRTARFISHLTSPQMRPSQRLGRIAYALVAMALHDINLGMLSNEIFAPPMDRTLLADEIQDDRRGFMLLSDNPSAQPALHQEIADEPTHPTRAQATLTPGNDELIAELAAASPRYDLSFVYFIFPKLTDLRETLEYPDRITVGSHIVPIINLAQPDRFPDLYDQRNWHDDAHFDARGATLASSTLAGELKAWYATHGNPPACNAPVAAIGSGH